MRSRRCARAEIEGSRNRRFLSRFRPLKSFSARDIRSPTLREPSPMPCQVPRLLSVTAVLLATISSPGRATEIVVATTSAHSIQVGETGTGHLPGFDPYLGILRGVQIRARTHLEYAADVENTGLSGIFVMARGITTIRVGEASGGIGTIYAYSADQGFHLDGFDGELDFAGVSGATGIVLHGVSETSTLAIYGNDAFLRAFVGSGVDVRFEALSADLWGWVGDPSALVYVQHSALMSGHVEATYFYDPLPAKICQNSGALWVGCPCGPGTERERGCANSFSGLGASLEARGVSSLSVDSLTLLARDMPDGACFLLQGSEFGYASTPLGDGRLCLRGSVMRMSSASVQSGSASFPTTPGRPISSNGYVAAPGTRSYQVVYRDPMRFCTPSHLNATNGVAVLWIP